VIIIHPQKTASFNIVILERMLNSIERRRIVLCVHLCLFLLNIILNQYYSLPLMLRAGIGKPSRLAPQSYGFAIRRKLKLSLLTQDAC